MFCEMNFRIRKCHFRVQNSDINGFISYRLVNEGNICLRTSKRKMQFSLDCDSESFFSCTEKIQQASEVKNEGTE
jgi:hypothetical protein